MLRGIDVSKWQVPERLNWSRLAETHNFVYCRATYGSTLDSACQDHFAAARAHGIPVGLYHFFRQSVPLAKQLDAFAAMAESVELGPGDLLPVLDLEPDTGPTPSDPQLFAKADAILDTWATRWGGFVVYTTASFWSQMGKRPRWLDGFLWVAHWGVKMPATPDNRDWHIWQHAVEPLPGVAAGKLDQNVAKLLPVIRGVDAEKVKGVQALTAAGMAAEYFEERKT